MALDPSLILGGNGLDAMGAITRGRETAFQQAERDRQNALAMTLQQNGAGLVRGDQSAVNALAAYDPQSAMQFQDAAEERRQRQAQAQQAAAELIAQKGADAARAEADRTERILKGAAYFHANGDRTGYDEYVRRVGGDPAQFPFEQFPAIAASAGDVIEVWKNFQPPVQEPPKPTAAMQEYNFAKSQGFKGTFLDYQMQGREAGAPNTTVNMGGGSDKQVFDAMAVESAAAKTAVAGYNSLVEAKRAVDGGIISGTMADQVLTLQKLGAALGVADPTIIQNTETFRSAIAPQVAAMIRATVGNANISNADREFAEKAAGGSISLDEGSIKRLMGIMEKAARANLQSYQSRLDAIYPDNGQFGRERALFSVQMPQFVDFGDPPPVAPIGDVSDAGSGSQGAGQQQGAGQIVIPDQYLQNPMFQKYIQQP